MPSCDQPWRHVTLNCQIRGGAGVSKVARPLQINVHGGGSTTGNVQRSKPTWLKRPVATQRSSFQTVVLETGKTGAGGESPH